MTIWFQVWRHKYAWPFHTPVDPEKLGLPDYYDIIKTPMDLTTIKKKLDGQQYKSAKECIADFDLMFQNCYTYNRPTEDVTIMAKKVQEFLHQKVNLKRKKIFNSHCFQKLKFRPKINFRCEICPQLRRYTKEPRKNRKSPQVVYLYPLWLTRWRLHPPLHCPGT